MALTVARWLEHPSLAPAQPRLVAGAGGVANRVRWVHSSEVVEIAPLLSGGEVLLTGGRVLAGVDGLVQERYIRELAERRVAAVAIETGPALPEVPEPMLRTADELDFPVIELRRVVPFVRVAEAVNGELVNDSVSRLQFGGELAHALSVILSEGGGALPLLEELSRRTATRVTLLDGNGDTMAEAGPDVDPETGPATATTRIVARGAHLATLAFHVERGADLDLLATAGDRAAEALGLALLRTSSPAPRDVAASELARSAHRADLAPRLVRLGAAAGLRDDAAVVALALEGGPFGRRAGLPGLDQLLRRHGQPAIDMGDADVRTVLALPDRRHAEQARRALVTDLGDWARQQRDLVVSIGPAVASLAEVAISMRSALAGLAALTGPAGPARATGFGPGMLIDASASMLTDWLLADEHRQGATEFVRAQLAMVLALRAADGGTVLETLEAYLDSGCNKTRTAAVLHLRRQSLYARLEKAFAAVGGDPTGTPRALGLHVALKLRHGVSVGVGTVP